MVCHITDQAKRTGLITFNCVETFTRTANVSPSPRERLVRFPLVQNEWDILYGGHRNWLFITIFSLTVALFLYQYLIDWPFVKDFFRMCPACVFFLKYLIYPFIMPLVFVGIVFMG